MCLHLDASVEVGGKNLAEQYNSESEHMEMQSNSSSMGTSFCGRILPAAVVKKLTELPVPEAFEPTKTLTVDGGMVVIRSETCLHEHIKLCSLMYS